MPSKPRISFQGAPGAYSDIVARTLYPDGERVHCPSFTEALQCLKDGRADYAVIPVTNTSIGAVTNAVDLLKQAEYSVFKTHWQPIHHCLLALPQAEIKDLRTIHSHWQALGQCAGNIAKLGLKAVEEGDTANAARQIAEEKDITKAAIASSIAAQEYGLKILKEHFEDKDGNRTLFLSVARGKQANALGAILEVLSEYKI